MKAPGPRKVKIIRGLRICVWAYERMSVWAFITYINPQIYERLQEIGCFFIKIFSCTNPSSHVPAGCRDIIFQFMAGERLIKPLLRFATAGQAVQQPGRGRAYPSDREEAVGRKLSPLVPGPSSLAPFLFVSSSPLPLNPLSVSPLEAVRRLLPVTIPKDGQATGHWHQRPE